VNGKLRRLELGAIIGERGRGAIIKGAVMALTGVLAE
jgi:hypothetical protein